MAVRVIDFPNNGGRGPNGDAPRVETGAIQFGNDWPGLFVRGDEAHSLAMHINRLERHFRALLEKQGDFTDEEEGVYSAMKKLLSFRRIIYDDVMV